MLPIKTKLPEENKFTYIIGNNGSGKSRILEYNAKNNSFNHPVVVISNGANDRFTYGPEIQKRDLGSYNYQGNRTVGNAIHINTLSANAVINYIKILGTTNEKHFKSLLEKINFDPVVKIKSRKTKRSDEIDEEFETQELTTTFAKKFKNLILSKNKAFDAIFCKNGEDISLSSLSSGEQAIISTALRIVGNLKIGTFFYIDEPEISLHIEWQSQWPLLFQNLISKTKGVKMFVATHSPIIISNAIKEGADCYNLKEYNLEKIDQENSNVEKIIFDEFHTYTPDNKYIYSEFARILGALVDLLNSGNRKQTSIDQEIESLKNKIYQAISTEDEKNELKITFIEFSNAINQLRNQIQN